MLSRLETTMYRLEAAAAKGASAGELWLDTPGQTLATVIGGTPTSSNPRRIQTCGNNSAAMPPQLSLSSEDATLLLLEALGKGC